MRHIEDLLREAIGLDVQSIGRAALDKAVQGRVAANHLPDLAAYQNLLNRSAAERQALIEAVVVPETWFFRDPEASAALTLLAARQRLVRAPASPGEPLLRILSLPCSTGEEPYSLAMALLDAGWAPATFRIDAVDISRPALALAERAIYGPNSFRGATAGWRERHFEAVEPNRWHLRQRVRDQVELRHGNLFEPTWPQAGRKYDFVICSNELIYFDLSRQDQAAAVLANLLAPGGALFVGPSETAVMLRNGLRSLGMPLAFAFTQAGAAAAQLAAPSTASTTPVVPNTRLPATSVAGAPIASPATPRAGDTRRLRAVPSGSDNTAAAARTGMPPVKAAAPAIDPLEHARLLADQGRFDEAAALCEERLRTGKHDAATCYLLGLIRDAAGDAQSARELFRKTLYLDPEHDAAMAHLAALLELAGDAAGAHVLRQRAHRVTRRQQAV